MSLVQQIAEYRAYLETAYPGSISLTNHELVLGAMIFRWNSSSSSSSGGSASLNWTTPTQGTIGTTSGDILLADTNRKAIALKPNGKIWLNIDADTSSSFSLFELNAGDTLYLDSGVAARINAIAEVANTTYTLRVAT